MMMVAKIGIVLGVGLAAVVAMVPGRFPRDAMAAKNPAKASVKCRKTIGQGVLKAVTAGLKTIQKCHVQRLKGRASGDCNSLAGAVFDRAEAQALARINAACKAGDPVADNYNAATVAGGFTPVLAAIQAALEESGAALQAPVVFEGDAASVKARRKCHGALGLGRTAVVQGVVKTALKCQQGRDKRATTFGPIDPSCLPGAGSAGGRASGLISRACGAFGGVEVGSCAALPGCLVTAAEATGQRIARLTFGGPATCGDGNKDVSEECDDGNTVDNDGCSAMCRLAVCGDLAVNQPSEECDEPNGLGGDEPSENCFECKLNVCGDGRLDAEEPGLEECDGTAEDDSCPERCTAACTCGPVLCGPTGLIANLALEYPDTGIFTDAVAATALQLTYPASLSIPGSGTDASVRARVTRAATLSTDYRFFPRDTDTNTDAVDDLIRAEVIAPDLGSIDATGLARIHFDCAQNTPVTLADVPCAVAELVMHDGTPFPPDVHALARCAVTLEPSP
jgi:cysteine-rich repeat protein